MTHAPWPEATVDAEQAPVSASPARRPSLYDRFTARVNDNPRASRLYSWLGPALVLLIAAVLRLWDLAVPHDLMNQFDETYYVKDGWTITQLGYEGSWPDGANEKFLSGDVNAFLTDPSFVIHPPLGKWIIGLGMLILGPESGWGWRLTTTLLGIASVLLLMLIAKRLTRSTTFAVVAGLLMATDGLAITMSRVALLDGSLTFFVLLGLLFVLADRERTMTRLAELTSRRWETDEQPQWGPVLWSRPWLIGAGAAFGAATAVKWSGVWVLAGIGIYLVVTDALARRRLGIAQWPMDAVRQGVATFTLLVPVAFIVYFSSWTGWLVTDGGYDRHIADGSPATGFWSWVPLSLQSLWRFHVTMYSSAAGITSEHAYDSPALEWPILRRPTSMYYHMDAAGTAGCDWASGCVRAVSSIPNPLVWYAGMAAVIWLAYRFVRARDWRYAFVLFGVAVTWVPWLFFPDRTIFQFYTVLVLPFVLLALTFALQRIAASGQVDDYRRHTGQRLVLVFLAVALAVAAFWYPLASGMLIPYDYWHAHMWLPTWI